MATRIGPAGTIRVAIVGSIGGQNVVNVFWCSITHSGSVTQADLDTWTASFGAAYKTNFASLITSNYHFGSANATYFVDGTDTNVMSSTQVLTGNGTGAASDVCSLALVMSWLTSAYWRGGKPRSYILGTAAQVSATIPGQWATTYVASGVTAAGAFRTAVNALTGGATITTTTMGFVSFTSGNVARTPPLFLAIGGAKVHPRVGHQRRRDGVWVA